MCNRLQRSWSYLPLFVFLSIGITRAEDHSALVATCRRAAEHYAAIAFSSYSDSRDKALALQKHLEDFVADPNERGLVAAKEAWLSSRKPYLQTEVFRFYAGPIDDDKGLEPLINGWPLDEFYIDYVRGAPKAGIINSPLQFPKITPDLLQRHNEQAGETAITCGFHAIEFLLWGQDFSVDSPGKRPLSDFTSSVHADRRGHYLLACGELLVRHLNRVLKEWAPDSANNYRTRFLADDPRRSLWYAVYGMRTFAGKELAGERLLVAWDTQAQEDEHSCFSDNTLNDLRYDALGLKNIFEGLYHRDDRPSISGPGLNTVFNLMDQGLTLRLGNEINEVQAKVDQIPYPFDQTILGTDDSPGRKSILNCVEQLEDIATALAPFEQWLIASLKQSHTND